MEEKIQAFTFQPLLLDFVLFFGFHGWVIELCLKGRDIKQSNLHPSKFEAKKRTNTYTVRNSRQISVLGRNWVFI